MRKLFNISILLVFTFCNVDAQVNAFASVKLDRSSVYPQQPIKASITVYTETWFTQPLDVQNIQLPNAFVIPFKRTLSSMRTIDGKKYASLEFYYILYPYEEGKYTFPQLRVGIETPPVGDYKGQSVALTTKAINFEVKEHPKAFEADTWFVAKNFYLSESWNKPLEELKVGDVVERSIRLNAKGTLPNFIPDINLADLSFASIYKQSPQTQDTRTSQDANGVKTETFLYLLEKEGDFTIPEVRVDWWNPYASKAYFKTLPERQISIKPNPELGMLTTLQDSLSNQQVVIADSKNSVQGIDWKSWLLKLMVGAALFLLILKIIRSLITILERRNLAYHQTELFAFHQIKKASEQDRMKVVLNWWTVFYKENGLSPSFNHEIKKHGIGDFELEKVELETLKTLRKRVHSLGKKSSLSDLQYNFD